MGGGEGGAGGKQRQPSHFIFGASDDTCFVYAVQWAVLCGYGDKKARSTPQVLI